MSGRLFASYVRRGAAAAITEADPGSGAYPGPAMFQPTLSVARDTLPPATLNGPSLPLLGPGAVLGLDSSLIVRTDPTPGATGVEDNYLALVELARPDLPWLFTPAAPSNGRLRPWLVLAVVEAATTSLQPGAPLPRITVADVELPDLDDSWGWAHVQVVTDDQGNLPPDPFQGSAARSRLLCPRQLAADTSYLACLVPATQVGAQAGLGLPLGPGPALAPAWIAGAGQDVTLPVYYSWTFATGPGGDFRSLVQRLTGQAASTLKGFGTRAIDISAPWETPPQLGAGLTLALDGALTIDPTAPEGLSSDVQAQFETRLTNLLNFPASQAPANAPNDPKLSAVAPPIYGGRHAGSVTVPPEAGWLRTLNLDPRRRIAAAFGTRYVQENKEFLMARAWDQLGAVQEANRLRARAELAAEIADRLHARHLGPLGPSAVFSVAAPARARVVTQSGVTLQAAVGATFMPSGAATPAFNRFTRPLGPVGRRAYAGARATVIERGIASTRPIMPTPAVQLDGIATLSASVGPAEIVPDATLTVAGSAFQRVVTAEQAIQPPSDLTALRQALTVGGRGTGLSLGTGLPAMLVFGPPPIAINAATLAADVADLLRPSSGILRRLASVALVPDSLGGSSTAARVMASPLFPAPLALALIQRHPERLLPGLGNFPDDTVTLLQANGPFVEAFLAGANHEVNRELLWRGYPTDQRGTPFRWFWPRPAGSQDIPPMTAWSAATALGQNGGAGGGIVEDMIVLLVRGEVLRRYPRTIVYAAKAAIDGIAFTLDPNTPWVAPSFLLRLDATTTAFAYPLAKADVVSNVAAGVAGWFFMFSEPMAGPRFRFEVPAGQPFVEWSDLDWASVPQARGFALAGLPLAPPSAPTDPGLTPAWDHDAADIGRIAFARPFRVGYHADELLGAALS